MNFLINIFLGLTIFVAPITDETFPLRLAVPGKYKAVSPANKYMDAVVAIYPEGGGLGSGFFIDSKGTFVTNYHVWRAVVKTGPDIRVETTDGEEYTGKIINVDAPNDLAVAKLINTNGRRFKYLKIGSNTLKAYQRVYILGNGGGALFLAKTVRYLCRDDACRWELRLTDGVIPGDSGGPIIDERGEVVGVASAFNYRTKWTLAVPAEDLKKFLTESKVNEVQWSI